MSIATDTNRWTYTGNGATTSFAYTNKIFAAVDLVVNLELIADGTLTLQVLDTHYSVTGVLAEAGGQVVFGVAPPSTHRVVIVRTAAYTQPAGFDPRKFLSPTGLENAIDRATVLIQQLKGRLDRAITLNDAKSLPATWTPLTGNAANTLLGFDANQQPYFAAGATLPSVSVSVFMATVLDDSDAAAARDTLGVKKDGTAMLLAQSFGG